MKRTLTIPILIALLLPLGLFAQVTDQASASVDAVVQQALDIELEAGTSVDFGIVSIGQVPVLDPKEASHQNVAGTVDVAEFNITGSQGTNFTLTYSNATLTDGTNNLTFTPDVEGHESTQGNATDWASGGPARTLGSGSPNYKLWVGGSLSSPTVAATYTGTFTITVDYN